jgi:hypothetical protein
VIDEARISVEPISVTKGWMIARLWELAAIPPEETRGNLRDQIKSCKVLYCTFGYKPALGRLSELASIDPARTKGHRRGQESAAKWLKRLVSSIKVGKNQEIQ